MAAGRESEDRNRQPRLHGTFSHPGCPRKWNCCARMRRWTDPEHTSSEHTVVEAVLKADSTGVLGQTSVSSFSPASATLARWASSCAPLAVSRCRRLLCPMTDTWYLHNGRIHSGSDWIPECTRSQAQLRRMLVVRYPIRTKGDLLRQKHECVHHAGLAGTAPRQGGSARWIRWLSPRSSDRQLRLEGTLTLHSETAKKNGATTTSTDLCKSKGRGSAVRPGSVQAHATGRIQKQASKKSPRGGTCRRSLTRKG